MNIAMQEFPFGNINFMDVAYYPLQVVVTCRPVTVSLGHAGVAHGKRRSG